MEMDIIFFSRATGRGEGGERHGGREGRRRGEGVKEK